MTNIIIILFVAYAATCVAIIRDTTEGESNALDR